MPDGGKLTLELSNAMLDDRYVRSLSLSDVPAGQYVMLGVTDSGTGMAQDVIERAFDPFFTTKPEGEGTGLGLSMAYGFVKQSGGHIRIYSEVGHGTTIRVYLPRSTVAALEPVTRRTATPVGGNETVLVVEDDKKVQETAIEMLSQLGYSVLKADNADQALAVLSSGVHVDLLFTDVVMPGTLKSPEMARRAIQLQPNLQVLFTSGYTQNAIVHGGRLDPGVELLSKPYSRDDIAFKLRQMLDPAQAAPPCKSEEEQAQSSRGQVTTKRILVVDDDGATREAVTELLKMLGHRCEAISSPRQALEVVIRRNFDILITDLNLPGMSGIDLARSILARCPKMHVIFSSGHMVLPEQASDFTWRDLPKPYTLDQLENALRLVP
ncbi:response regulator [Caballeronia sp. GAFFF2]|uniref:response regulator n=1 Tax=Caballeronia sp. GAFFF2 TaxID=2921741 RepID=UPI0032ED7620